MADKSLFRYKVWRDELFRIQSTFPQDEQGNSKHMPSDENILIGFGLKYIDEQKDFNAESKEDALEMILEDLGKALKHLSGEGMIIE